MTGFGGGKVSSGDGEDEGLCEVDETPDGEEGDEGISNEEWFGGGEEEGFYVVEEMGGVVFGIWAVGVGCVRL